jgi:hypothetical protein
MDSAFLQEFKEEADILEENAVQILNCSITKHANSQVQVLLSLRILLTIHSEQLYRHTEEDGCKGGACFNFGGNTDYPVCGFLWFCSVLPGKFRDSTFSLVTTAFCHSPYNSLLSNNRSKLIIRSKL